MKKAIIITLSVIIVLVGVGIIIHKSTLDGLNGFIWGKLVQEDTVYSPGYSDSSFKQITIGMPEREVKRLLGEPIKIYPPDESNDRTKLCYSLSPEDTNYRIRAINIKDGRVVSKYSEFYLD